MTLSIRVAITALSIASIAPAYAGEGEGAVQAPAQNTTTMMAAPAPTGHIAYVTQSNRGTWLFAPHDGAGANG
jgi:hypothetical protein